MIHINEAYIYTVDLGTNDGAYYAWNMDYKHYSNIELYDNDMGVMAIF